jgi:penicillin amidase
MAQTFRWLLRVFMALVSLAVIALILVYWLAARSLPDYEASHAVGGISAPVEIVRDNANVPHIFGETDADVFFALGFAHAQDRLWQMMTLRRAAQGRLSEIFGERTLRTDELIRRLDLYNLAVRSVPAQDAATRTALEAYADGVNARLQQVADEALGRGAPEFFLFSRQLAPWQPADSLAIIKLMGLRLSSHLQEEVLHARASLLLPEERLRDILPDAPGQGVMALPDYAQLFPGTRDFAAAAPEAPEPFLMPAAPRGLGGASNAWAAAPERAAANGTLLANDPHLGFSAPTIWYLARLELAAGAVIGGTIPGMPVVLVGRSAAIGWGLTSAYVDDQDLYIEKLNPDDPGQVATPEGWMPMRTRASIIEVADAEPVTIELRWTPNGPVLPGHHFNLASITPEGHVTSLAWTLLDDQDTSMTAAMRLMAAQTVEEAIATGELYVAPSQNLVVADAESIALKTIGVLPRRTAQHQTRGRIPSPGWRSENLWQGRLSFAANPESIDPPGGIIGNTNNKTLDRPFPFHVSYAWGDTQRIQRWRRLMQTREVHTRESFIEAQLDTVSFTARSLLPLIAGSLVHRRGRARGHARTPAPARAGAVGRLERRDERTPARAADLCRVDARTAGAADPRRARSSGAPVPHVEPLFIERVFRDVDGAGGLVRHPAIRRRGNLHRHRAAGARRCPCLDRRHLRHGARSAALGRCARGHARPRGAGRGAVPVVVREHPAVHLGRRQHADARAHLGPRSRPVPERAWRGLSRGL